MTKRALVLWAKHSATNLGVRVLASGAERLCEMAFGSVHVDFHDHDTPNTPLSRDAMMRDIGRSHGAIKSLFRNYDVIIDTTAGDSFTDIYGARRLMKMTYAHHAAIKSGVPLILAPQTIGPFNSRYGWRLAQSSVRGAARVYARDSESAKYSATLGRVPECTSSDLVFALPTLPEPAHREGLYLNVSGLLWRPNSHVDYVKYRNDVMGATRAVSALGHPVTLFPHVLRVETSREDDVTAVEEAASELGDYVSVFIPTSLDDVRKELSTAAAVVGTRMHACLNALSVGTPALAWAYSRKFGPLLSDLGWNANADLRAANDVTARTVSFVRELQQWTETVPNVRRNAAASIERVARDLATAL